LKTDHIITIVGPTASGKSAVALELAKKLKGEIVNGDSRQIYQFLHFGTSQPTSQEQKTVRHHLYDFLKPNLFYSAGQYAKEASLILSEIMERKRLPIVVGGTGLYIKALFDGISELPERDETLRKKFLDLSEEKGREFLHSKLKSIDPISAEKIPFQNIQRVVRALEVYELTGTPLSQIHKNPSKIHHPFSPLFFGLLWPRTVLNERIQERTKRILPDILQETKQILAKGFKDSDPGLQSLGYRQAILYLENKITYDECFQSLLLDTLHYAKRQMTWFRKDTRIQWIDLREPFHPESVAARIVQELKIEV
jgi:tRNA dimethylallyltransferase